MNDEFCICGERWIKVFNTLMHSDCYYCPSCDKIYEPTVREITRDALAVMYIPDKFDQIKRFALRKDALNKVTYNDLKRLGYIQ